MATPIRPPMVAKMMRRTPPINPPKMALPMPAPCCIAICVRIASACSGLCEAAMFEMTPARTLPKASWSGTPTMKLMIAPTTPAIAPITAPSPGLTGMGALLMYMFAAMIPPTIAQAQQQRLGKFTKGIAERMPNTTPPIKAGFILSFISVYTFTGGDRKTSFRSLVFSGGQVPGTIPTPRLRRQANCETRFILRGQVRDGRTVSRE
jgi:hypothetical protein